MALVIKDRVQETTTTTGTGAVTLLGAVLGYVSFSVIGNANTTYYCIFDSGSGDWETGIGTYTAAGTTLSRNTVYANSLGTTALINFGVGSKYVFGGMPASKTVLYDAAGNVGINTAPSGTYALEVNGSGGATSWVATSDERTKTDWEPVQAGFLELLAQVKSGTFRRLDSQIREAGVGAQSMEPVLKEAVVQGVDGLKAVNYGGAALVAAIELAKEVVALRQEITDLKAKIGG